MDNCQQFRLCFYVELVNICIYMICKEEIGKKKKVYNWQQFFVIKSCIFLDYSSNTKLFYPHSHQKEELNPR